MSDFVDDLKETIRNFLRDNPEVYDLPSNLVEIGLNTAVIEVLPKNITTPHMNNIRAKYASEVLKYTTEQKLKMDKIKRRLRAKLRAKIWDIAGKSLGSILTAGLL